MTEHLASIAAWSSLKMVTYGDCFALRVFQKTLLM